MVACYFFSGECEWGSDKANIPYRYAQLMTALLASLVFADICL